MHADVRGQPGVVQEIEGVNPQSERAELCEDRFSDDKLVCIDDIMVHLSTIMVDNIIISVHRARSSRQPPRGSNGCGMS